MFSQGIPTRSGEKAQTNYAGERMA
jgi:hypothetical protein